MSHKLLLFKLKTKRDPETFGQFYDIYVDRIYRFVYFKVSAREDVEDITSEVFLKLWQYLREENQIKNLNALVYNIARNLIVDYYRKKSRKDIRLDESENQLVDTNSKRLQSQLQAKIEIHHLEKLLAKLKDEYREVIILRFVEEYSLREIAQIMEKTVGAVKVLLHRALKRLRQMQEEKQSKLPS